MQCLAFYAYCSTKNNAKFFMDYKRPTSEVAEVQHRQIHESRFQTVPAGRIGILLAHGRRLPFGEIRLAYR